MLEEMEEIFDCIDLVQDNEYYIQLDYDMKFNHTAFIKLTEKYNGVYKIIEVVTRYYKFSYPQSRCYNIINENNIKIKLLCFYKGINSYIFNVELGDMYVFCKIYKKNNTEYILK